jgi:hypothetical protein
MHYRNNGDEFMGSTCFAKNSKVQHPWFFLKKPIKSNKKNKPKNSKIGLFVLY